VQKKAFCAPLSQYLTQYYGLADADSTRKMRVPAEGSKTEADISAMSSGQPSEAQAVTDPITITGPILLQQRSITAQSRPRYASALPPRMRALAGVRTNHVDGHCQNELGSQSGYPDSQGGPRVLPDSHHPNISTSNGTALGHSAQASLEAPTSAAFSNIQVRVCFERIKCMLTSSTFTRLRERRERKFALNSSAVGAGIPIAVGRTSTAPSSVESKSV
jgi:hypothetical protein